MEFKYDSPGKVDLLTKKYLEENPTDEQSKMLLNLWNEEIEKQYKRLDKRFKKDKLFSKFFKLNPKALDNSDPVPVKWFADPAEPTFCQNLEVAKRLSDWGRVGRHNLHNEYCEYSIIWRTDKNGNRRAKRVQFTTELREFWLLLAEHSPHRLKYNATSILGFEPSWKELYGIENPFLLNSRMRKFHFALHTAGNGGDTSLQEMNVPVQPIGKLNTENALFMTHPINGLDDLIYILMFGAQFYAVEKNGKFEKASKDQIFRDWKVERLACRHADPAAAMAAYNSVFDGKMIGISDPLGMYIHSFKSGAFSYENKNIPSEWVRFSRGSQHLDFGPSDHEDIFLDDIKIEENGEDVKLSGGFQIAQQIEVGPNVIINKGLLPIDDEEYVKIKASDEPIKCNEEEICNKIRSLENEYHKEKLYGLKKDHSK